MAPRPLQAADLLRLHDRVVAGDLDARDAIAAFLLEACSHRLLHAWPRVDPACVRDSVEMAVVGYLDDPRLFDPTKGRLHLFIEKAARRTSWTGSAPNAPAAIVKWPGPRNSPGSLTHPSPAEMLGRPTTSGHSFWVRLIR